MTDIQKTEIVAIIDRSGSMSQRRQETLDGFREFLEKQKKLSTDDGTEATLTLTTFASDYTIELDGVPLADVPDDFLADHYECGAMTALNDAVMRTFEAVGQRLAALDEDERPGLVVVVIITDGHENDSKEYPTDAGGREAVARAIKHQREAYNWQVAFIGANLDVEAEAASLGIDLKSSLSYDQSQAGGTRRALEAMTSAIGQTRSQVGAGGEAVLCFDEGDYQ